MKGVNSENKHQSDDEFNRIYLKNWTYSIDGNDFLDLPEGYLGGMEKLVPGEKGFLTLHTEFNLPWKYLSSDVGLVLGKIVIASKVYVNGQEVGGSGLFPPTAFAGGQAYTNIKIDSHYLKPDEKNILEIVLWVEGKGGISDKPFISSYEETSRYANSMSFLYSKLNLIFSWTMFVCALIYMMFFFQQRRERQYYDFGLVCFWTSLYLMPFWVSEIPTMIGLLPYIWWLKILNGTVAIVVCYYATSFIRSFLGVETSRKMRIERISLMWLGIVYTVSIQSVLSFYKNYLIFTIFLFLELLFGISAIFQEFKKKNENLKRLIMGYSPVILSVAVDVVIQFVLKLTMVPYITLYGWQLTAITFTAVVANRYAKIRNQYEYLNENLEQEVKERTQQLTLANEELNRRQAQAEKDMELAVHVQKCFYPKKADFLGWDVAVYFKPLSGVSGDLYDFFLLEGKLRGFGLFDVSGHGISSGLVTMLAKNSIFHSFVISLPLKIEDAMKVVNEQVIAVKGEIENYLTGCMFRFDKEDSSKFEFVNAGGPHPIFKSKSRNKPAEFLLPDENKPHYGMLGVKDLEVQFQGVSGRIKAGDSIILYTDGLTEAENVSGEQYGKERLLQVIDSAWGTSQEIVDAVTKDLESFCGSRPIDDDITIIVLKKTENNLEEDVEEDLLDSNEEFGTLEEIN